MKSFSLCTLLFLSAVAIRAADPVYPEIHQRVVDLSSTLTAEDIRGLSDRLAAFEQATTNQIVVLMISTLNGESIEDYTLHVAEKNQFGKKGRNNGVLIVIAKDDRKMRIEVGYGLEGPLPDAVCSQIIRQVLAPQFRSGNYAAGINAGIEAVIAATQGEFKGDEKAARGRRRGSPFLQLIILAVIALVILSGLRRMGGGGSTLGGSGGFVTGMFLGGMGRGFGGGGSGGGGFGDGGFGGGGFSGGGGSFGGGGASGSW